MQKTRVAQDAYSGGRCTEVIVEGAHSPKDEVDERIFHLFPEFETKEDKGDETKW